MENSKDSTKKLIINPSIELGVDLSSILSISFNYNTLILTTKDYIAKAIGFATLPIECNNMKEYTITDNDYLYIMDQILFIWFLR